MTKYKNLKNVERLFDLPPGEMKRIVKDFHLEMERGLSGEKSSLKMIPTYVKRPTGKEKGTFLALDLGGTNFRVVKLTLKGNGKVGESRVMKFVLDKKLVAGTGRDFFDFLAARVKKFMKSQGLGSDKIYSLGFTFSFPIKQLSIAEGRLICWTKGFDVKGVVGKDVVRLLEKALIENGVGNVKVLALVNDTVGTLAAKSYEEADCDIGVIIGTGTNACYVEDERHGEIINIEWGNFNKLNLTAYDKLLDSKTGNKLEQILEKMVSGMYLGRIAQLVLRDTKVFSGIGNFKAEQMSIVEADRSKRLVRVKEVLRRLNIRDASFEDRQFCKKICAVISRRASRISASCIAAIVTKIDQDLASKHVIAIDGSLYRKHPTFSKNMRIAMKQILGQKSRNVRIVFAEDGSGKGAAIIAAAAVSEKLDW